MDPGTGGAWVPPDAFSIGDNSTYRFVINSSRFSPIPGLPTCCGERVSRNDRTAHCNRGEDRAYRPMLLASASATIARASSNKSRRWRTSEDAALLTAVT